MIRRPPRSTQSRSSAASDVYKRQGYSWFAYKESRKVPTELEAGGSTPKAEAREAAVAEGKLTPEEFDKSFQSSPKAYYVQLAADFDGALESLQALDELCGEKFQDVAPSFGPLRQTLELSLIHILRC